MWDSRPGCPPRVYNDPMRFSALLLILTLFVGACSKEQAKPPAASAAGAKVVLPGTVLSVTVAPGSAFKMSVAFEPPQPVMSKKTDFRLTLTDTAGAPVKDAKVQAALVMPLMDMGKNEFTLQPTANGVYTGTGQFTMSGEWEIVVTAAAGGRTGKTTFNVRVED